MCLTETPLELTLLQTSSLHMHTCGCILQQGGIVSRAGIQCQEGKNHW